MKESWDLLSADAAERRLFESLASTLSLTSEPAGPRNRYREVRRIDTPAGRFYLKVFHRTQLKNRLRHSTSSPRATTDAMREAGVTAMLRARCVDTPRPVAVGRRGPSSYYLCAELRGAPLVQRLRERRCPSGLARRAAEFCGNILKSGVILPDLSAEHVWVAERGDRFAVLDLHNGYGSARVSRRAAARVLKHFRRSVRGLPVGRRAAMTFACRLLKQAGLGAHSRAILRRVPPLDTHQRYESAARAARYRQRSPARTARELDLLRRIWPGRPGDLVLDAPCGAGRLTPLLMDELGVRLVASDRSRAMLDDDPTTGQKSPDSGLWRTGQEGPDAAPRPELTIQADNLALPFADRSLDGVVVFRFLHHLPRDLAREVVREACRVARRYVLVSFFHPLSVHGLRRLVTELVARKARTRHALSLGAVRTWMSELGFRLLQSAAERPYLRDFWLASFVAEGTPEPTRRSARAG